MIYRLDVLWFLFSCGVLTACTTRVPQDAGVALDGSRSSCVQGAPESCNGRDDDCDESIDEDFACAAGREVVCTLPDGRPGIGSCSASCARPSGSECRAPSDRDGDGVADIVDAFPDDPAEAADRDLDGLGDRADTDADNDGVLDSQDATPLAPDIEIVGLFPPVLVAGRPVSVTIETVDHTGRAAVLSITSAQSGLRLAPGVLTWTPTEGDVGEQFIELVAMDGVATARRRFRTVVGVVRPGASARIGPEGGMVEIPDSAPQGAGARLVFPRGALTTSTRITISPLDTGTATVTLLGGTRSVGTQLLLEPEGIRFSAGVDLRLPRDVPRGLDPEEKIAAAINPASAFPLRPLPEARRDTEGRWHVTIHGFSWITDAIGVGVRGLQYATGHTGRMIDLSAQWTAFECSRRLQRDIDNGVTDVCRAFASLAACLWNAYETHALERGMAGVNARGVADWTFTPGAYLASLYDMNVGHGYYRETLGFYSLTGSPRNSSSRAPWPFEHNDGFDGSGFRVFIPGDPDRTGRKDHFVTNARVGFLARYHEFFIGDDSQNDLNYNTLGRAFGAMVRSGELSSGSSIQYWLTAMLCETRATPGVADAGTSVTTDAGRPRDGGVADTGVPVTEEVCDGVDNDGDRAIDDGCPASLRVGFIVPGPLHGLVGPAPMSGPFVLDCPSQQVVQGICGRSISSQVVSLGTYCGNVAVVADTSVTPHRFTIAASASSCGTLTSTASEGTSFDFRCPANSVVQIVRGDGDPYLGGIQVECVHFGLVRAPGNIWTIVADGRTTSPIFGGMRQRFSDGSPTFNTVRTRFRGTLALPMGPIYQFAAEGGELNLNVR